MRRKRIWISLVVVIALTAVLLLTLLPIKGISIDSWGRISISLNVASAQEKDDKIEEPYTTKIDNNKYVINFNGDLLYVGKDTNTFVPEITMYRWGEECFLTLYEPTINGNVLSQKNAGSTLTEDTIQWASKDLQFLFYPKPIDEQSDFGSFEYEITLANSKAGTDQILKTISFPISSSGLAFYYQPPLTQEEIDEGCVRPENVVGSYAVYHDSKSGHVIGETNYMTGKAFHIYRPMLIDNVGNTAWANLIITDTELIIDFSEIQDWLNKAKYPVTIDPNFGYETIGGSTQYISGNDMWGSLFTSPADVDTADSITWYGTGHSGTDYFFGIIVLHSNLNIISNGVTDVGNYNETPSWNTATYSTNPSLSASTGYVLMMICSDTADIYYDTGDANQGHYDTSNSWISPSNPTDAVHSNYKQSIYCTYTTDEAIIDIGGDATDRAGYMSIPNYTYLALDNPANSSGTIDTIQVWSDDDLGSDFTVGTFYLVSGTTYKCRDSEVIGVVTGDSLQTFHGLSITVQSGDFIGFHCTTFSSGLGVERDYSGGSGIRYVSGDYCDPDDETSYSLYSGDVMSLWGTGSDIDVGEDPIDRPGIAVANYTLIALDNPANASGTITQAEIWAASNLSNCVVGTFYLVSGTTYKCRDSESIGSVTSGSRQVFTGLTIDVSSGDYIGMYYTSGTMERHYSGYSGIRYVSGEYIDPDDQTSYSLMAGDTMSLFARGEISGCSEDITNTPASWNVNGGSPVAVSSTYTTGLTYFTVTNNSGGAVDIDIRATDMTGGNTWTLSDTATPGSMIYGLKAGLDGGDYTIIVKKNSPYNDLVTGLADSGTQDWGLKLYTPTVYTDGATKTGTVTISATCQ